MVERELFNHDFFLSIEDDMELTTTMVEAFRRHAELTKAPGGNGLRRLYPGWIRYEKNQRWENRSHCLWGE